MTDAAQTLPPLPILGKTGGGDIDVDTIEIKPKPNGVVPESALPKSPSTDVLNISNPVMGKSSFERTVPSSAGVTFADGTAAENTEASLATHHHSNIVIPPQTTATRPRPVVIAAEEPDDDEDFIPGPPAPASPKPKRGIIDKIFPKSPITKSLNNSQNEHVRSGHGSAVSNSIRSAQSSDKNEMDLSLTDHHVKGSGIMASRKDLSLPPAEFAAGCNLLQACAIGDMQTVRRLLQQRPNHVHFRDYDRRTALHVSASEGQLTICKYLIEKGANINRSDRWGGSALDDAHRHRHHDLVLFLRAHGAITGSGNRATNLITAAAEGDVDEVKMLLTYGSDGGGSSSKSGKKGSSTAMKAAIVNKGDYDKRTPLHLACSEGHVVIVELLCQAGADVIAEDRWGSRPLDDAMKSKQTECCRVLEKYGATPSPNLVQTKKDDDPDHSQHIRESNNLKVDFDELEMVDRIGSGAFGEIFKCNWRGTFVAAKCIKSARIRQDWITKRALENIEKGGDVDDAMLEMDQAEMEQSEKEEALNDFRQEISVLKSLRHPNIVLLLAFSTTENYEVIITELMQCSLLDVFKAHIVHGTRLAKKTQISYAIQLARGMNYLHKCKPPIIHRDLKPANLLLDHTGVLKISDFGLAKVRPDPKKMEKNARFMTGETGSYRFMAPEVFRHEDYNETVDVYSYAMILFYLLDGRPPWPTLNGMEAVRRASDEGERPAIPRHWDSRLQSLLMECWGENQAARPPFSKILAELNEYSRDVFHTDITQSKRPVADTTCNCIIL